MAIKINSLKLENVKRVKAVAFEPTENGLTIIGGKNRQGKTSVLDAICWALGGNKFRPSEPHRDGSVLDPEIHITLSNGLVVERKGKNSDLKVIDPSGQKNGQKLLDSFISELALDLPRFINANDADKAKILLGVLGIEEQLMELTKEESTLYNQRQAIGRIADSKRKHADEMQYFPDAPEELISASDLIRKQQIILAKNGENQKKRQNLQGLIQDKEALNIKMKVVADEIARLKAEHERLIDQSYSLDSDIAIASKTVEQLKDESTAELEKSITDIDTINSQVRINQSRSRAMDEAEEYSNQYTDLTAKIEAIRNDRMKLLDTANLPLPELSIQDGCLVYKGKKWDCMSSTEQLQVSVAIVQRLNPNCGFVLMDKLEQFDNDTLQEFGDWLVAQGLQVIATRVGTGEECSIIIEDGFGGDIDEFEVYRTPVFKEGVF